METEIKNVSWYKSKYLQFFKLKLLLTGTGLFPRKFKSELSPNK